MTLLGIGEKALVTVSTFVSLMLPSSGGSYETL